MRHLIVIIYAWLLDMIRKPLLLSVPTTKLLFIPGMNGLRNYNGKVRAYFEFTKAKRSVPAYRTFLDARGFSRPSFNGMTPNISEIPVTDKSNYVMRYHMDARCMYGIIPDKDVIIDESSGSSGTATNWVRGKKERQINAKIIRFSIQHLLGTAPMFIINAFALGPWATGVNVTMSCVKFAKLKSLGPDKVKIENTIKQFGSRHHYVVMGYPPFLKLLVDNSNIPWHLYNVTFIFGGESMSEGMRDYLISKGIKKIYSSLGASDLELNLAGENNFTISLRRLIRNNPALQNKLLKHHGALPMIFQFNPTDFLFESSAEGELIVTVCRTGYLAPKIRYNIHDRGHVMQLKELFAILKELNIDHRELARPITDLPLLFHYGRSDSTVSFFGANITPADVQEAIYNLPVEATKINSFSLNTAEDVEGNKKLTIAFEMQQDISPIVINIQKFKGEFIKQLSLGNQDFREAKKMVMNEEQILVQLHNFGHGPFKNNDIRIKAKYIN